MKARLREILDIVLWLVWKGFGLLLFILGGSAGAGAVITGSWVNGVLIAWSTLMLGIIGAIGYAIVVTGKVSRSVIDLAARDAVEKAKEQETK